MTTNTNQPVVACFGGGVDSTTLVAIDENPQTAARWLGITEDALRAVFPRPDIWIFSDTGAEHDATYEHVAAVQRLLGDRLVQVRRDGENIYEWNTRLGTVPLMPGASHICSLKFKGEVMQRYVEARWPRVSVHWLIGIEADEEKRAKRFQKPRGNIHDYSYPLMGLGLTRARCEALLEHLGWALPVKSSCVYCPFKTEEELRWMFHHDRNAWDRALNVEDTFRETSPKRHQAWLDAGQPLNKAGRAPRGMWRKNSWAEGARLFAKSVDGRRLSMREWAARFEAEIPLRIVD